jgi:hypothetical protein
MDACIRRKEWEGIDLSSFNVVFSSAFQRYDVAKPKRTPTAGTAKDSTDSASTRRVSWDSDVRGRTEKPTTLTTDSMSRENESALTNELVRKLVNQQGIPRTSDQTSPCVQTPHEHDVILGRGNGVKYHPGNLAYRVFCWNAREAYTRAPRESKAAVIDTVLQNVYSRKPPGRFLELDESVSCFGLVDVPENRIRSKIGSALRERKWTPPIEMLERLQESVGPINIPNSVALPAAALAVNAVSPGNDMSPGDESADTKHFVESTATAPTILAVTADETVGEAMNSRDATEEMTPVDVVEEPTPVGAGEEIEVVSTEEFAQVDTFKENVATNEENRPIAVESEPVATKEIRKHRVISPRRALTLIDPKIGPQSRVAIFWPMDDTYYEATVVERLQNCVSLHYDDGESEWIDLTKHKFRILAGTSMSGLSPDEVLAKPRTIAAS